MEKRWRMRAADPLTAEQLGKSLGIHPVLCTMLAQRGVQNFDEAKAFFRPTLDELHDPFLMKDMQKAVDRIILARDRREKVMIYGDYDVDGTTAVGCMYSFLVQVLGPEELNYYIPHRYREGYGISTQGVDHAIREGYNLVIALDCGIKSIELINHARQNNVDFIVCDHHIPGSQLPPAVAILNPKQNDCPYPYKELCGCGVGLKLIMALVKTLNLEKDCYLDLLDLAATAIAADIVPITGENRIIAYYGLKKANQNPSTALRAIMNVSGIKEKILIHHLVFLVAPRVNAAGRMDDARKVVDLFVEKDPEKARIIADQLHSDNKDRKEADLNITEEALTLIREYEVIGTRRSTVLYKPHWHKGVVGIVASRLIEHYYRPTVVLTKSGDIVAGSARSIPGFNIHDGLEQCREYLIGFGGHYFAAGMTMLPENVEAFSRKFDEIVTLQVAENLFTPEILIDAEIELADCSRTLYKIVHQMEPFGPGNPQPIFVARGVTDTGYSKIVKENHLRFSIRQNNAELYGIGFNIASKCDIVTSGQPFDIVFNLDENLWQGNSSIQMKVIDIRSH
jgi:single-stranded-DNA-specific exonuclease